jgi:hypothetical protein
MEVGGEPIHLATPTGPGRMLAVDFAQIALGILTARAKIAAADGAQIALETLTVPDEMPEQELGRTVLVIHTVQAIFLAAIAEPIASEIFTAIDIRSLLRGPLTGLYAPQ